MPTDVIVLNGGSSSGKTTIARRLQEMLPGIWLSLGVDDLIAALPASSGEDAPIAFGANGSVLMRESFRRAEAAWWAGVAAMARSGAGVIIDDAFLGGPASQADLVHSGVGYDLEVDTATTSAAACAAAIRAWVVAGPPRQRPSAGRRRL